jgi:hypothetical protein
MSEFLNADGSGLVGALNPSNIGQALQVDASGNLKIAGTISASNPSTGTNGSTTPSSATLVGGSDGTNLQPLQVESTSNKNLRTAIYNGANELAVDASGRLSANISQWAGAAPSVSNPVITQDQLRALITNGQGFSATTGKLTAPGSMTGGLSVFNPAASGKTLLVYSLTFTIGNNSFNQVNFTTSDPALGTSATVSNNKSGGPVSVASCSYANSNISSLAGNVKDIAGTATNTFVQMLSSGNSYVLPAGNGLVFYANLSGTNIWFCNMAWIEM